MRQPILPGLAAALAAVLTAVTLSACGGSGSADVGSTDAAVKVAGTTISRATLQHWADIEAITSHEFPPHKAPEPGIVPDPPKYFNCIAYLAKVLATSHPSTQELKTSCVTYSRSLRGHVLEILIDYYWVRQVAKERGVAATPKEINATLINLYSNEATVRRLMAVSGETRADLHLLAERNILVEKLLKREQAAASASSGGSAKKAEEALIARATAFTKEWIARTDCRPEFVMALCKQYKGRFMMMVP
jgi:hypothetical protein